MTISNKIRELLKIKLNKSTELAGKLGLGSKQAMNMKYRRESFSAQDLIKLADLTDTTLSFVDQDGKVVISFDMSDLEEATPQEK